MAEGWVERSTSSGSVDVGLITAAGEGSVVRLLAPFLDQREPSRQKNTVSKMAYLRDSVGLIRW